MTSMLQTAPRRRRNDAGGRGLDMMMAAMLRVFVSGKVQKTGYRDWAVSKARELGVTGWVRNLRDGRIELLVAGEDAAATALVDACREGPALARVDHVEAHADTERMPKGFTKRFTA